MFPEHFARVATVLTYAQYWSYRLTGIRTTELTSLGCHTDLWNPKAATFSSMVDEQGWRQLFAPVRRAGDVLGPLLRQIADETGLPPETPVHCGIHDSNASLLPHLITRQAPFSVASTGTWVVMLAVGAEPVKLDERRDTLINVNALGDPVPSARFMPKMDGLGLLQAVRANPATKKAAFIILTAQGDRALVQKAAALGANNVLAKPFTIEKMKAAIEAVFGALK